MITSLINLVRRLLDMTFVRYGIMAVTVVGIELTTFWIFNTAWGMHYLLATWLSLAIGIVLNWLGSRYYVFGSSMHHIRKEFGLVVFTSLAGALLQSAVVSLAVEAFNGPALGGKAAAIIVTFFWNYFIRKKYIYRLPVIDDLS